MNKPLQAVSLGLKKQQYNVRTSIPDGRVSLQQKKIKSPLEKLDDEFKLAILSLD